MARLLPLLSAVLWGRSDAALLGPPPTPLPGSGRARRGGPARPRPRPRLPAREAAVRRPAASAARGGGAAAPLAASSSLPTALLPTGPLVTAVFPKLGIATSTLLYLAPLAAVRAALRDDAVGDLNPLPVAIMAVSSFCWLAYGLAIQDPYVTLSNVPGSIVSLWYVTAILPLLRGAQLRATRRLVVALAAVTVHLWAYLSLSRRSLGQVRAALGLFASGLFVVLAGSPLSTIRTVLATRDASSILAPLTAAQVANCALWSFYGLAIRDRFVYGPNLTGLGFGLVQLSLKLAFPSK